MAEPRRAPARPPLVGRDVELERMQAALDEVGVGAGRLLLVSGEPGIGKTRLVEELAALAVHQGAMVAWGRVGDADGAPPYSPWIQLVEAVLDEGDPQVIGKALGVDAGAIADILPAVKELVADVRPLRPLDPAPARFRLHRAIVDFLGRVSVHRRLVLILDDLQWADPASLELTRFAAARLGTAAVLLVVTYRCIDGDSCEPLGDVLASLARQPKLERLMLDGLNEEEVGRFMAQTIGLRPRPAMAASVHARTEGNPFFVAELARLLQSEGLLGAAIAPGPGAVPVGVRDVVRRRLARLPEATRELLVLGAILGRDFDLATLGAAGDYAGEDDVLEGLEPALAAGVVNEAAAGVGRLRFSHALIRDAVYGELSPLRRARLHARVGHALEVRNGTEGFHLPELAWHFFHAAPVTGPGRGLGYALEAAMAAQASLAYEQAEHHLRRAVELIELMPAGGDRLEQGLHVQNRLAALLTMTRGHADPQVGRACARARELSRQVGQTDELVNTLAGLTNFHLMRADFYIVAELAAQFLAIGDTRSDALALATGHLALGLVKAHRGQLVEARASFVTAADFARALELSAEMAEDYRQHLLPLSLGYVAQCAWLAGDDMEALMAGDEAIAIARRRAHPYTLSFVLFMSAQSAVFMADARVAEERADESMVLCRSRGFVMLESWCQLLHGWAISERGLPERGRAEMTAALAANEGTGARLNRALFLGLLADGHRRCGNAGWALESVEEALLSVSSAGDRLYESELRRRRAELLATQHPDRIEEATASLREAITLAETQGAVVFRRRAEIALALLDEAETSGRIGVPVGTGSNLSPRECEILALVGRGLTDKAIALALTISVTTVHSHLDRIRDKTGRRRRPELTRLAVDLRIIAN